MNYKDMNICSNLISIAGKELNLPYLLSVAPNVFS